MEILNYTGKSIGLTNDRGQPFKVLPSQGNAHFETVEYKRVASEDGIVIYEPIFGRVNGLPKPDLNHEKVYIVDKEIALRFVKARFDLVVGIDPISVGQCTYFKKLVNYI